MKATCLVVVLCCSACVMAGKYSREVNEQKPGGDGARVEFRVGKLNQVWEKAQRVRRKHSYLRSYSSSFIYTELGNWCMARLKDDGGVSSLSLLSSHVWMQHLMCF